MDTHGVHSKRGVGVDELFTEHSQVQLKDRLERVACSTAKVSEHSGINVGGNAMSESSGEAYAFCCVDINQYVEKKIAATPISDVELEAVQSHLNHCSECRDFVKWTSGLSSMADVLSEDELDSAFAAVPEKEEALHLYAPRRSAEHGMFP